MHSNVSYPSLCPLVQFWIQRSRICIRSLRRTIIRKIIQVYLRFHYVWKLLLILCKCFRGDPYYDKAFGWPLQRTPVIVQRNKCLEGNKFKLYRAIENRRHCAYKENTLIMMKDYSNEFECWIFRMWIAGNTLFQSFFGMESIHFIRL